MDGSMLQLTASGTWSFANMSLPSPYEVRRRMGLLDLPKSLDPADIEEWLAS